MGDGYGPRLVSRPAPGRSSRRARGLRVAVPGLLTTAYLALQLYQPDCTTVVMPFDQIEDAVHRGEVDVGLLIHEGQLTYGDAASTSGPTWAPGGWRTPACPCRWAATPCAATWARPSSGQIARDLRASIVYALEHRAPALAHASSYNRGIGDERTDTFVGMYVNQWTVDYGPRGRQAVQICWTAGTKRESFPERVQVDFVDSARVIDPIRRRS